MNSGANGGRIILVSNRLPVTVRFQGQEFTLEQSGGGLATGLKGARWQEGGVWLGWPGETPSDDARRRELNKALADIGTEPIYLTRSEQKGFYDDFSNGALWPVFHDLIDQLPLELEGWQTYKRVNEKFAEATVAAYKEGDTIWIHDYHLMLLPQLVRQRLPKARIGFFLHIPFPAHEIFRVLPERHEIMEGLMGADLIGFHTPTFAENFMQSARTILGLRISGEKVRYAGRSVRIGAFPMGVDAATWEARARSTTVAKQVLALMQDAGKRKIIVSIDRLDYTKGLLRRIAAIERLLHQEPSLADRVRFVQVTFPSRERLESYAGLRRQVNELVGRLNASYGSARSLPIHLVHRSFSEDEVSALYCAADIMLVTPLRDGMNLVSKEFVASRLHNDGVLILSEFAGAAEELSEAVIINPYDIEGLAASMRDAIEMPMEEQRVSMAALREKVLSRDVHWWVESFLDAMNGGA
jgi:trehalose 6-phosphate synthase/phosphatase